LVEVQDDPHHKKAKLVKLTKEGRRRFDLAMEAQIAWANGMTNSFSTNDLETAFRIIKQLRPKIKMDEL